MSTFGRYVLSSSLAASAALASAVGHAQSRPAVTEWFALPRNAAQIVAQPPSDTPASAAVSAPTSVTTSRGVAPSLRPSDARRGAQQNTPEARARAEFERGVALADRLQWAEASEAFEHSYAVLPRPGTLRNLGLSHRALGRYIRAMEELQQFLRDGNPDADTRAQIEQAVSEMQSQIATITVSVTPPEASATLDNQPVSSGQSIQVDPGTHVLAGRASGFANGAQTVNIQRGDRRTVELRLERAGTSVFASPAFWIPVGLVVAGGLTVGGILLFSREGPADCGTLMVCASPRP